MASWTIRWAFPVLISAVPLTAQSQTPPPEPAEEDAAEPEEDDAFPLAELAARSEEALNRLIKIQEVLRPSPELIGTAAKAKDLEDRLASLLQGLEQTPPQEMSRSHLPQARGRFEDLAKDVGDLAKPLRDRVEELETIQIELASMDELWKEVRVELRDSTQSGDVPAEVLERPKGILRAIDARRKDVTERLKPLLVDQNELSTIRLEIEGVLTRFAEAEDAARGRLFSADSPPLWTALSTRTPSLSEATSLSASRIVDGIRQEFLPRYRDRLPWHALVCAAIILTLIWLRRRQKIGKAPAIDSRLLDRPISVGILASLLLSLVFYPKAPIGFRYVVGVLGIIPTVRVVMRLVEPPFHRVVYGLTALFVLDSIEALVPDVIVRRLILLLIDMSGIVGSVWVLSSKSMRSLGVERPGYRRALTLVPPLALALLAAVIANLLGFVQLARLLSEGCLNSVYVGVAISVGASTLILIINGLASTSGAQQLRAIRFHQKRIIHVLEGWIRTGAFLVWAWRSLEFFELFDPIYKATVTFLFTAWPVGEASFRPLDVVLFLAVFLLTIQASRLVQFLLQEEFLPPLHLARGVPVAISRGTSYVLLVAGFLLAVAAAGIDVTQLTVIFGALGVGVGFGLQNLVNNFVSGLILVFERPIQVGDLVEFGTRMGHVVSIGIRASIVRLFDGAEVIVPNGDLVSAQVINYNLSDRTRRIEIKLRVPFESDLDETMELLIGAAEETEVVVANPKPTVSLQSFDAGSVELELWCWVPDTNEFISTRTAVSLAIHRAFQRRGLPLSLLRHELRWASNAEASTPSGSDRPAESDSPPNRERTPADTAV